MRRTSLFGTALVIATAGCSNATNVTMEFEDDGGITVEMDSTFSPPPTCPTTTTWISNVELVEAPGVDDEEISFGNGTLKVVLNGQIPNSTPYSADLAVTWNDGVIFCGEDFLDVSPSLDPGRKYCARINGVGYAIVFTIDITFMNASSLKFDLKVCQDEEANCENPSCEVLIP